MMAMLLTCGPSLLTPNAQTELLLEAVSSRPWLGVSAAYVMRFADVTPPTLEWRHKFALIKRYSTP